MARLTFKWNLLLSKLYLIPHFPCSRTYTLQQGCLILINFFIISLFPGCSSSASASSFALFYTYPRYGTCLEVPHATPEAEGLLVFPPLDVIHLMDFPPCPGWDPAWTVALSVWKDCSSSLLAVCGHHCLLTQSVLACHVPHWNKRDDDQKTWDTHWCLSVRGPVKFYGWRRTCWPGTFLYSAQCTKHMGVGSLQRYLLYLHPWALDKLGAI